MIARRMLAAMVLLGLIGTQGLLNAQQNAETVRVEGLTAQVEIIKDQWGISHIYAETEEDLFFAQGYNAARDRLFQFEVWRRQTNGTVAEILGERELRRDIGTRLFMFRGDIRQEMNHYHQRGESIITSYVRGVNAYIEETERNPELLPLEFELLGIRPGRWTPETVVSRHQGLLGNIGTELDIARAVATVGADKVKELLSFSPGNPNLEMDPAIEQELLFDDILGIYNAFRRPVRFRPEDLAEEYRDDSDKLQLLEDATDDYNELQTFGLEDIGSNNWVVSGALTQNGFPVMANDPHRAQSAPSLRYWVHLVGPGWNVIGGGEPEIPGVSIGHNGYGAWGLTVFSTDGEDLYVYETNPENPNEYRYRDHWESMTVIQETIPVKGRPSETVDLKYTRHGPVVYEDAANNKAYAVRGAWMEVGGAPYLASLRMDQAQSWEEFREGYSATVSLAPAAGMAALGVSDGTVALYDWRERTELSRFEGYAGSLGAVSLSPDGELLAASGGWRDDPEVWVWRVQDQQLLGRLAASGGGAYALAFSPDHRLLAAGGRLQGVQVWRTDPPAPVDSMAAGKYVHALAFSPDGRWLAWGESALEPLVLWDVETAAAVPLPSTGRWFWPEVMAFSPSGHMVAMGNAGGRVLVWDADVDPGRAEPSPCGDVELVPDTPAMPPGGASGPLPLTASLAPARPNPSRGTARLSFHLPEAARVRLEVYDLLGQRVRVLALGQYLAGAHEVAYDGHSNTGQRLASGVYLLHLQAGEARRHRKVLLLW